MKKPVLVLVPVPVRLRLALLDLGQVQKIDRARDEIWRVMDHLERVQWTLQQSLRHLSDPADAEEARKHLFKALDQWWK